MKRILKLTTIIAALIAAAPQASKATIFFNDTFTGGSTLTNASPAAPTATSAAYHISSSKANTSTNTLSSGFLRNGISSTTSGGTELQSLFTTTPVALVSAGDFIRLTVTFTNSAGLLTANCLAGFGLYNGGQVQPHTNGVMINNALNTTVNYIAGGVQNWQGYWGQVSYTGGNHRILSRAAQTAGTENRTQNLTSTGSGSQSYGAPAATAVSGNVASTVALTPGASYTEVLEIVLTATGPNTVTITNTLYSGPNTNGAVLAQFGGTTSGASTVTAFDGIGIGWRATAASTGGTVIDISSIKVDGQTTTVTAPPDIVTQPIPATVPSGGSCLYSVVASGFNLSYQWKRNNTNIANGGNISGATSDTLIISPASAADALSNYYVTVSGAGGYSTNSATNSLTIAAGKNLVWSGVGNVWDLNTSTNWLDGANPAAFNYGDAVTLNDTASGGLRVITLTGKYLSASSVTVDGTSAYTLAAASTGGFAGPGNLIYKSANSLAIANVNTYTGGTIISNASAYLFLQNYGGLGTGPVTLAKAGGTMEIDATAGATVGIAGNVNVQDDFNIQFDRTGSFAGVFLGNLSGTAGKTLTLNQLASTTTNRYRIYGTNTVMNADIAIANANSSSTYPPSDGTVIAPYHATGSQTYNGVISGSAAIITRDAGTTILNAQNTYSGGTIVTAGTVALGANSTPTTGTVTSGPIGTGPLFISAEIGSAPGTGTILAFGGARTIANSLKYPNTTNTHTLALGGTNALTLTGSLDLNGFDGSTGVTNRPVSVSNTNAVCTISGVISGVGNFIKTGAGILDITAAETYTGNTAVSNGTLRVNGSLAGGAVTVATNSALGGAGTIAGPVTVLAGGSISPGNSIGTLNINNNLTLSGNLSIEVNRSGSQSDKTIVSGTLSNAGTGSVNVTNLGAAFQAGDSFALFNKAVVNGNLMTVSGGGSTVTWTNKLAVDGTIAVLSVTSTTPTNITSSVSGSNLTLSWPSSHTGWTLQSNVVSVTSSSNWFPVSGSSSSNSVTFTINPAKSNVFYRLTYP